MLNERLDDILMKYRRGIAFLYSDDETPKTEEVLTHNQAFNAVVDLMKEQQEQVEDKLLTRILNKFDAVEEELRVQFPGSDYVPHYRGIVEEVLERRRNYAKNK